MHRPIQRDAPRRIPLARRRSIVARATRLRRLEDVPGIQLHLADEAGPAWHATAAALEVDEAPIPFWAFAWAGGLAIARYLADHPGVVAGRTVLDVATGSGLCAIAAMQAGAAHAMAADVDPFAEAAVECNARANAIRLTFVGRDLLDEDPPEVDVILAGDTSYEAPFADRVGQWLSRAAAGGITVLVGDPGRRYLPDLPFTELARYQVRTTTELEDRDIVTSRVLTLPRG